MRIKYRFIALDGIKLISLCQVYLDVLSNVNSWLELCQRNDRIVYSSFMTLGFLPTLCELDLADASV